MPPAALSTIIGFLHDGVLKSELKRRYLQRQYHARRDAATVTQGGATDDPIAERRLISCTKLLETMGTSFVDLDVEVRGGTPRKSSLSQPHASSYCSNNMGSAVNKRINTA